MTAPAANRSVLVVDDDEAIRTVVRTVLEAGGYSVAEATNGSDAMQLVAAPAACFDAAVLDVMMPGVDGVALCHLIDHDHTRVVMLSARDDAATRQRAAEAGASAYLTKPFSAIELLDLIEDLVTT